MVKNKSLSAKREIIRNFRDAINEKKHDTPKPTEDVIDFRTDKEFNIARKIYLIDINLLHYRPDNGRIKSKISSLYLHNPEYQDETTHSLPEFQDLVAKLLKRDKKGKFEELKELIASRGQDKYAIATCDGFLIDGNRRKAVIEELYKETRDPKYSVMKVILLPDGQVDGDGGPPTHLEIKRLERVLQRSRDGKSEFTTINKALEARDEIALMGGDIEAYIKDDPNNKSIADKPTRLKKEIKTLNQEQLRPLEMIDLYLDSINRQEDYEFAESLAWDAFRDIDLRVLRPLKDNDKINAQEYEDITKIGFYMISTAGFEKDVLYTIRDLKKFWEDDDQKKKISHVLNIGDPNLKGDEEQAEKARSNIRDIVRDTTAIKIFHDVKDKPLKLIQDAIAKIDKVQLVDIISQYDDHLTFLRELTQKSKQMEREVFNKSIDSEEQRDGLGKKLGKIKQKNKK
jgi:hypothetical protein